MAVEYPVLIRSFVAARDYSTKQYHAVKMSGAFVELCSAVGDKAIGILQNKPSANETADVMLLGVSKVKASNTALSTGQLICPTASGTVRAITPASSLSNMIFGHVVLAGSANGLASAFVIGLPHSMI